LPSVPPLLFASATCSSRAFRTFPTCWLTIGWKTRWPMLPIGPATRTSATQTFTVLLGAVAAISLLVGGIGVTNIMLVTVTERIREIGIRKAIGAPRSAILGQFLAEATMLSLFGGLLGVAIGVIGSQFTISGIKPVVVPSSILLAFAVSALIGLFFGSFPANRAAKLRPIDALRHE